MFNHPDGSERCTPTTLLLLTLYSDNAFWRNNWRWRSDQIWRRHSRFYKLHDHSRRSKSYWKWCTPAWEINAMLLSIDKKGTTIGKNRGGSQQILRSSQSNTPTRKWWRCGGRHNRLNCKHKSTQCHKCEKIGQLRLCKAVQEWRRKQNMANDKKNVGSVRIGAVLKGKVANNFLLKIIVQLNDHPIEFHLDSGAERKSSMKRPLR